MNLTGIEYAYEDMSMACALGLYLGTMTEEEAHAQTMERLYRELKQLDKEKLKQLDKEKRN